MFSSVSVLVFHLSLVEWFVIWCRNQRSPGFYGYETCNAQVLTVGKTCQLRIKIKVFKVVHDVHAINKSPDRWIRRRKKRTFDLIKKEWENSWLADKFEQENASWLYGDWSSSERDTIERHKTCWRNKLWADNAQSVFVAALDYMEVIVTFNWNEIIRWLHRWALARPTQKSLLINWLFHS